MSDNFDYDETVRDLERICHGVMHHHVHFGELDESSRGMSSAARGGKVTYERIVSPALTATPPSTNVFVSTPQQGSGGVQSSNTVSSIKSTSSSKFVTDSSPHWKRYNSYQTGAGVGSNGAARDYSDSSSGGSGLGSPITNSATAAAASASASATAVPEHYRSAVYGSGGSRGNHHSYAPSSSPPSSSVYYASQHTPSPPSRQQSGQRQYDPAVYNASRFVGGTPSSTGSHRDWGRDRERSVLSATSAYPTDSRGGGGSGAGGGVNLTNSSIGIITAFRDLQARAREVEEQRLEALCERDRLRSASVEAAKNDAMWRSKSEIASTEALLEIRANSHGLKVAEDELTKRIELQEDVSSKVLGGISAQRNRIVSLETEGASIKNACYAIERRNEEIVRALREREENVNNLTRQIASLRRGVTGSPAKRGSGIDDGSDDDSGGSEGPDSNDLNHVRAHVTRLEDDLLKTRKGSLRIDIRVRALQKYMELVLKINEDLTDMIIKKTHSHAHMLNIAEKYVNKGLVDPGMLSPGRVPTYAEILSVVKEVSVAGMESPSPGRHRPYSSPMVDRGRSQSPASASARTGGRSRGASRDSVYSHSHSPGRSRSRSRSASRGGGGGGGFYDHMCGVTGAAEGAGGGRRRKAKKAGIGNGPKIVDMMNNIDKYKSGGRGRKAAAATGAKSATKAKAKASGKHVHYDDDDHDNEEFVMHRRDAGGIGRTVTMSVGGRTAKQTQQKQPSYKQQQRATRRKQAQGQFSKSNSRSNERMFASRVREKQHHHSPTKHASPIRVLDGESSPVTSAGRDFLTATMERIHAPTAAITTATAAAMLRNPAAYSLLQAQNGHQQQRDSGYPFYADAPVGSHFMWPTVSSVGHEYHGPAAGGAGDTGGRGGAGFAADVGDNHVGAFVPSGVHPRRTEFNLTAKVSKTTRAVKELNAAVASK